MKNQIVIEIDAAVICYDCALKECCPCTKKNVPFVGLVKWKNDKGTLLAFCHVKERGKQ